MKGKKKRLLAGTLALLLSCSTLLNTGITALASEQSEEHAQIQEVKQEEAASETLPELEEVKEQLTEEELVYAEDLTIKAGESFDLETDYRGFQKNDEKVKVTFLKAEGDSGNSFDFNTPGSYQAFYRVDPLSGKVAWKKGNFVANTGRKSKNTEEIAFFTKGKARNLRPDAKKDKAEPGISHYMSGARGMLPTVFDIEPPGKNSRIHQAEKPVQLLQQILGFVTEEKEWVLDQFAGSFSLGEAALLNERNAICIEINEEYFEKGKERLLSAKSRSR